MIGRIKISFFGLFFLILLVAGNTANATEDCIQLEDSLNSREKPYDHMELIDIFDELNSLKSSCYRSLTGSDPWLAEFLKISKGSSLDTSLIKGVKLLSEQLRISGNIPANDILSDRLDKMLRAAETGDSDQLEETFKANDFIYTNSEEDFFTFGKGNSRIAVLQDITAQCARLSNQSDCLKEIEQFHYIFYAMSFLANRVLNPALNREFSRLNALDSRWNSYFDEATPQNLVELFINKWVVRKFASGECSANDIGWSTYNQSTFYSPPKYRIRALSPSVALEYIDEADDGNQFEEALILELVGISRWSWSNHMKSRSWGASLIAAYSDRNDIADLGLGLLFKFDDRYSLGLTSHDGNAGVFLSVDLQKYFTSWTDRKRNGFSAYSKLRGALE